MISRIQQALFVFAFVVHASIPAGFMLAPVQSGSLSVVICTAAGPKIVTLDDAALPIQHEEQKELDAKLCAYATTAAALVPETPFQLAAEARYASIAYLIKRKLIALAPLPSARSARGPPALMRAVA